MPERTFCLPVRGQVYAVLDPNINNDFIEKRYTPLLITGKVTPPGVQRWAQFSPQKFLKQAIQNRRSDPGSL